MIRWKDVVKCSAKGRYAVNPAYQIVQPFSCGIQPGTTLPYTLAGTGTPALGIHAPRNSDNGLFEGYYSVFADSTDGTASANWTADIPKANNRKLTNFPTHIQAFAGTAQLPSFIREPLVMLANEQIVFAPQKISGGSTSIWFYLQGILWNPDRGDLHAFIRERIRKWTMRRSMVWPQWITPEQTVTLSGNASNQNFDVMIGDHFQAFKMTAISTGSFSVEITEVRSGKTICNGPFTKANAIGDATLPTVFDKPLLIPAGSRLRFTLNETSGSSNTIYIALHGRSIDGSVPIKDVPTALRDSAVDSPADAVKRLIQEQVGAL